MGDIVSRHISKACEELCFILGVMIIGLWAAAIACSVFIANVAAHVSGISIGVYLMIPVVLSGAWHLTIRARDEIRRRHAKRHLFKHGEAVFSTHDGVTRERFYFAARPGALLWWADVDSRHADFHTWLDAEIWTPGSAEWNGAGRLELRGVNVAHVTTGANPEVLGGGALSWLAGAVGVCERQELLLSSGEQERCFYVPDEAQLLEWESAIQSAAAAASTQGQLHEKSMVLV